MRTEVVLLYVLYLLVGVGTLELLSRYKMRVAFTAYATAFFTLLLYLPVYAGSELMTQILSHYLYFDVANVISESMRAPLIAANPYFAAAFFAAVHRPGPARLHLAICRGDPAPPPFLSFPLLFFVPAFPAIHAVRRYIRRRAGRHLAGSLRREHISKPVRIPQKRSFCHTFCRYNC